MHEITAMKAKDGDDIIDHLAKLKQLWDRTTLICQADLPISPKNFKWFLAYSLPAMWDDFTCQFSCNPAKKDISIHEFIGECNEEYQRRLQHDCEEGNRDQAANAAIAKSMLINQLGKQSSQNQNTQCLHCTHCGRDNHEVKNCYHINKPKCTICKKIGHDSNKCRFKKKSTKA